MNENGEGSGPLTLAQWNSFRRALRRLGAFFEPLPEAADVVKKINKGGAPTKYDWEGAFIEMAFVTTFSDDEVTRDKLNAVVKDWFDSQNVYPSDSQIRDKVKRFHERLWPPKT